MSDRADLRLGRWADDVEARLRRWDEEGFGRRLWEKDPTLWSPEPVPELTDRMGWLTLPESMAAEVEALERFAAEVRAEGFRDAVVLGMGGSSLAPEVFSRTFGSAPGFPALTVLDSTHPDAVRDAAGRLDPAQTLFLVSSKSGTTTETNSLFRFFWKTVSEALGDRAGGSFVAITDPGTVLERLARERGFRAVFNAPEEVGGRYSALTTFGLVPAALIGADLRRLLERGRAMAAACAPGVTASASPGLRLGAALGELAAAGRDKVTFLTSPTLASFPDWIEQLVAESTGKHGQGIVPVVGEPVGAVEDYGGDRVFVGLLLDGEIEEVEEHLAGFEAAGHPVARFHLSDPCDLGGEIFRWEVATAAAGAVLGINPFDQPDVQLAKELASKAMKERGGGEAGFASPVVDSSDLDALEAAIRHWLDRALPGDYLGIHAYVPRSGTADLVLPAFQEALRERSQLAATAGYGPRFLHSTGQLHKGGPSGCRFLQIVDEPTEELPVPETDYSFRTLIRAQADGDLRALEQRGREVLRIRIPPAGHAAEAVEGQGDIPAGLSTILSILQGGIE